MNPIHKLYWEAISADHEFSRALKAHYGRAHDVRYWPPSAHPPAIRALSQAADAAMERWLTAGREVPQP